jgi:acetyl esterase/lipase
VTIPGCEGAGITLSVFAREDRDAPDPGIYRTHGGGMIIGDRFTGIDVPPDWVERFDAVCVSVEYRLAPEFPDPYLTEDCYAGLAWTAEHAGRPAGPQANQPLGWHLLAAAPLQVRTLRSRAELRSSLAELPPQWN